MQYVDDYDLMLTFVCIRISTLAAKVSNKPIGDHQKSLILDVTAEDAEENDVDLPYVMVTLSK